MRKLRIQEIEPGMELAEDVKEKRGMILLKAGQQITKKNLEIFERFGVTEVTVQDSVSELAESENNDVDPQKWAQAQKKVQLLFRHTNLNHPAIKVLYDHCMWRAVQN